MPNTNSVEEIVNLLIRSKLLEPAQVKSLFLRWQSEAGKIADNPPRLLSWLVDKNYLTDYQAKKLSRGQSHFFLNQYKITDRVGKGHVAGVYKAVHWIGQVVALKILPPSKLADSKALARFRREARLASKLVHPNVVRTFHMDQTPAGVLFIVMEYLAGETLQDRLTRMTKLPPVESTRLIHQALLGLQHIHEHNMVHRDMKPDHLMLVASPTTYQETIVKIIDIGVGRSVRGQGSKGNSEEESEVLTGQFDFLGTPTYMAPEQTENAHRVDIRADIYSLGCVLFHALTGQPPFVDKNVVRLMQRHRTEQPRRLKDFDPTLPDSLQNVVNRMLAKDPGKRYPTPAEAAHDLVLCLTGPQSSPEAVIGSLTGPVEPLGGNCPPIRPELALSDRELLWKYLHLIEKEEAAKGPDIDYL